ncbi:hypothetical protein BUALT_Bualt07G0017100 [Buddleja alternifolia]|uniref:Transcription factor TFIIB cyclin-like domain-containing protein n=1 Tax=Buddleja alternifolia TaxID=168488 RepID=A0AAV6XHW7_9LAMI|nr:hypothetical protein BUALT_Bualt07G0017100 [Buddleja alternifolia]
MSLVTTIKDRVSEIYKRLEDQKCTRGRNLEAIVAACIYIACRQEGKPHTVKEICSIVSGATKKEIGRAKEFIVKQLKVEMGESMEMGTIHAGDYLRRFCSFTSVYFHSGGLSARIPKSIVAQGVVVDLIGGENKDGHAFVKVYVEKALIPNEKLLRPHEGDGDLRDIAKLILLQAT